MWSGGEDGVLRIALSLWVEGSRRKGGLVRTEEGHVDQECMRDLLRGWNALCSGWIERVI